MVEFKNLITLTQISDGAPGPAGPAGTDTYKIETNVEEIFQFKDEEGNSYYPSSELISFSISKLGVFEELDLSNVTLKYYVLNGEAENISSDLELTEDSKTLNFNIKNFLINNSELCKLVPIIFEFSYVIEKNIALVKRIVYQNGLSMNMLDFSVNAGDITAAIQESRLQFSAEGLTIFGSNFRIKDSIQSNQTVLEATNDGRLILNNIISESGNIGGFVIDENKLMSQNGQLELYGKEGKIIAHDIQLGNQAVIQDSIAFSNNDSTAYLYNPEHHNGKLLVGGTYDKDNFIENLIISSNGNAQFGNISIDSTNSTITATQNNQTCWQLAPDRAYFENIVASGSIETAIFKKAYTQAVGGAMIFKPSYKILSINENKIVIEGIFENTEKAKVWLAPNTGNFKEVIIESIEVDLTNEQTILTTKEDIKTESFQYVIDLGRPAGYYEISQEEKENPWKNKKYYQYNESNNQNKYEEISSNLFDNNKVYYEYDPGSSIIGINAGNSRIGENSIMPRGLTITNLNKERPSLFLGDLTSIGYSGYGLYSDNVFLTGALTTVYSDETGFQKYAGINTLSGITANFTQNQYGFEDNTPIVIWAGAENENSILDANFFVTSGGTAKMKRAYITDSSFYDGEIRGADIYAARIHGTEDGGALSIYDTNGGIKFFTGYTDSNSLGSQTCEINSKGFITDVTDVSVKFQDRIQEELRGQLNLSINGLIYQIPTEEEFKNKTGLKLDSNKIDFTFDETSYVRVSNEKTEFYNQVILGQKIQYTYTDDGCDMYVFEEVGV